MRRIIYTPKARFALDSMGGARRAALTRIGRLRDFDPDHPAGVSRIDRPRPLYVLRVADNVKTFFRLLPSGAVEVVDLINTEAADLFRAEAGQPE